MNDDPAVNDLAEKGDTEATLADLTLDTRVLDAPSSVDPSVASLPEGVDDTQSSPQQVMRREELARMLALNRAMRWLSLFLLATLPFFGGELHLRYFLLTGLALGIPGGLLFDRMIKRKGGVTDVILMTTSIAIGGNLFGAILFFGTFSGATGVVVLALFAASRTEFQRVGLLLYLFYAIGQAILGSLIIFNVMEDPGLLRIADRPLFEAIMFLLLIEGLYLAGFLLGRMTRGITMNAIEDVEEARRKVGQRDALLREARQDLDRALVLAGGPGHYTERKIGSFMLGNVIGRGGMAEVYEAWDVESSEAAAVKMLHQNLLMQPAAVARFLREAKAASALSTPHVARILGSSEQGDSLPYLAMERLYGQDLAHYLRHEPAMSMAKVLELVEQVANVIDLASDAGIVHRDLKPQNLFLAEIGPSRAIWKVLDFGVSLLGESSGTLTQGSIVGTPSYMSPEQARGHKVDQRTDIHALAAITYRCLTGRPCFAGKDIPSVMYAAVHFMPERPSIVKGIPKEVDAILAIGLAKNVEDRFDRASDFFLGLQRAARGKIDSSLQERADALLAIVPWGGEQQEDLTVAGRRSH